MTGTVHEFPAGRIADERQEASAPPLPVETHIVAAALSADRLRAHGEALTLILRYAPRDAATFARIHNDALTAWCELDDHYRAYQAVLECKGQG
jgi:hypothetical protein